MKKKAISIAIVLAVILGVSALPAFASPAQATSTGVKVLLDGNLMTFDVPPQIINNRTMVPLRAIFEAMGAKVDWVGETQTVTGTKDDTVVILKIGDVSPTINGIVVPIDQPAVIKENRTLAPLRFVAEAFGGTVDWESSTQTASITMGDTEAATPPSGNTNFAGRWWRAGLPGFGFILLYLDSSGEFTQEVRFNSAGGATHWEQVYKGNYSISGDKFTFTYKFVEHRDAGKEWGTIALPGNKTLAFAYVEDDEIYGDYLDFTNGGLPPFDEPVTRLENQGGNEDLFVTRFRSESTYSSVLNR